MTPKACHFVDTLVTRTHKSEMEEKRNTLPTTTIGWLSTDHNPHLGLSPGRQGGERERCVCLWKVSDGHTSTLWEGIIMREGASCFSSFHLWTFACVFPCFYALLVIIRVNPVGLLMDENVVGEFERLLSNSLFMSVTCLAWLDEETCVVVDVVVAWGFRFWNCWCMMNWYIMYESVGSNPCWT